MTKKILLLVAATAVMVLMLAPVAWANSHTDGGGQMMQGSGGGDRQMMQGSGGGSLPASGGLPILPIVGAAAATLVLAGGGIAYRRRGR